VALTVLGRLAVPNEAVLDAPVGLAMPVEVVLGRLLEDRSRYSSLGGAWPAPCYGAWRPGWARRDRHGPVEATFGWHPVVAHTIPVEALCSPALRQLPNTALSVLIERHTCRAG
jgi:hypothetical protein